MAVTINASTSAGLVQTADTSGVLALQTAGTTAVTVDASQNVGIGTTTMTSLFNVASASSGVAPRTTFTNAASAQAYVGIDRSGNSNSMIFGVGTHSDGAQKMTIDSSGNVGIGTTSPATPLNVVSNSGAVGVQINGRSSDGIGVLKFTNNAGSTETARLQVDTTPNLIFCTGNAVTERMRITSAGDILLNGVGTSNPVSSRTNGTVFSYPSTGVNIIARASAAQIALQYAGNAGANIQFYTDNGAVITAGTITSTGTATAYGVGTSDYRAKENVSNYTGGLSTITSLRPVSFTWKESQEQDIGFIAHEIQAVIPSTVHGEKDAIDEDGKPKMQVIFPAPPQMIANLVAAIQEQQALITQLQADVAALKGA